MGFGAQRSNVRAGAVTAHAPQAGISDCPRPKKQTYADIFSYFRDLIRIRKLNAALKANMPINIYHVNDGDNVIAFHRWLPGGGNDLVVIASFNNGNFNAYDVGMPIAGEWYELLNSQAGTYGGNGLGKWGASASPPVRKPRPQRRCSHLTIHVEVFARHYTERPNWFMAAELGFDRPRFTPSKTELRPLT